MRHDRGRWRLRGYLAGRGFARIAATAAFDGPRDRAVGICLFACIAAGGRSLLRRAGLGRFRTGRGRGAVHARLRARRTARGRHTDRCCALGRPARNRRTRAAPNSAPRRSAGGRARPAGRALSRLQLLRARGGKREDGAARRRPRHAAGHARPARITRSRDVGRGAGQGLRRAQCRAAQSYGYRAGERGGRSRRYGPPGRRRAARNRPLGRPSHARSRLGPR